MTQGLSFAILGAKPRFNEPLPVGQFYWPDWELYEAAARDIFQRRYYTSQRFPAPLVIEFQNRLQSFLGVKHAIAVRNATNGLMIVAKALGLGGDVVAPSWTSIATVQSLLWSKCRPVFCDIDPKTQQMSVAAIRRLLEQRKVAGILGVHLWGNAMATKEIDALATEYGIPVYYNAAHAFGCSVEGKFVGASGRAEVFSLHAANILNTGEGGIIATNDDELVAKFRAMRGDHAPEMVPSLQSATARMSEIQAAIGMMMLNDFERNRQNNEEQRRVYEEGLGSVPGISILNPSNVTLSNFQTVSCVIDRSEFGLTRDVLVRVLNAENVAAERPFYPPVHATKPFSDMQRGDERLANTDLAARDTLLLPIGALASTDKIKSICDIIAGAHRHAEPLEAALSRPNSSVTQVP